MSGVRVRMGARVLTARSAALATGKHNVRGWPRRHGAMTAYKISLAPSGRAARALAGVVQLGELPGRLHRRLRHRGRQGDACAGSWTQARCAPSGADWRAQLDDLARQSVCGRRSDRGRALLSRRARRRVGHPLRLHAPARRSRPTSMRWAISCASFLRSRAMARRWRCGRAWRRRARSWRACRRSASSAISWRAPAPSFGGRTPSTQRFKSAAARALTRRRDGRAAVARAAGVNLTRMRGLIR